MNLKHKLALPFTAAALLLGANTLFAEEAQSSVEFAENVVAQINGEDITNQLGTQVVKLGHLLER